MNKLNLGIAITLSNFSCAEQNRKILLSLNERPYAKHFSVWKLIPSGNSTVKSLFWCELQVFHMDSCSCELNLSLATELNHFLFC